MKAKNIDKIIVLLTALKQGKKLKHLTSANVDITVDNISIQRLIYYPEEYTIRSTPHYRPWKSEEVPVGKLIRFKGFDDGTCFLILGSDSAAKVALPVDNEIKWKDCNSVYNDYEHSLDNGLTWLPYGVLVENIDEGT